MHNMCTIFLVLSVGHHGIVNLFALDLVVIEEPCLSDMVDRAPVARSQGRKERMKCDSMVIA
jgi:hypothetical protein